MFALQVLITIFDIILILLFMSTGHKKYEAASLGALVIELALAANILLIWN